MGLISSVGSTRESAAYYLPLEKAPHDVGKVGFPSYETNLESPDVND